MRDRRETAWVEFAAARIATAILRDAFRLAGPDIDDIELRTTSIWAKHGLLKNATDPDAFSLQAFHDCAEETVDIEVALVMDRSECRYEIS